MEKEYTVSEFTRYDNELLISYDAEASGRLGRDHWRVRKGFRYYVGHLGSNMWVDVPAGKLTDGATVPFPFNALIPVWGSYGQAVVVHDALCDTYTVTRVVEGRVVQRPISRKEIDQIFNEAMKVLKVESWRRKLIMAGVTLYRLVKRPRRPERNHTKEKLEAQWVL